MRADEFPLFVAELKQLCASLGKPYNDPLAQAYWRVLKDIPLTELEQHVERILLNANKDTKFPRPAELRSTPVARGGTRWWENDADPNIANIRASIAYNRTSWELARQSKDPEARIETQWAMLAAYLAKADLEEVRGSVAHQEKLSWVRGRARELLRLHGDHWRTRNPRSAHVCSLLVGP